MTANSFANRLPTGFDGERLRGWMAARGLGSGPITDAALLTGGTQNLLLRFRMDDREYVLRRPPLNLRANSNETMQREARVLSALADTRVPHPRLIAACASAEVIGASFYLMEPVRGFNATEGLPALHASRAGWRREMGLALVDAAAALGAVDHEAQGLADFGRLEGYLERQVPRWRRQLADYAEHREWPGPDRLPHVAEISAWLDAHRPAGFSPGIIHGDYHLANVLFDIDRPTLAAIVDWELSTLGDPLLDLGWLLATWPDPSRDGRAPIVQPWDGFPSAGELIDRYAQRSGRDMSALPWFAVLACFKLGVILEGTYARACAGLAPVETGERLHASTLNLFERAARFVAEAPSGVL